MYILYTIKQFIKKLLTKYIILEFVYNIQLRFRDDERLDMMFMSFFFNEVPWSQIS